MAEQLPKIESDGIYKILAVDHFGDTCGNEWYSEVSCIAASQAGTPASVARGRTVTPDALPATAAPAPTGPAAPTAPANPTPPRPPIAPLPATATLGSAGQG